MIPGSANPLLLAAAEAEAGAYEIERSLRFNSSDSAYLSRTPASAGNRRTFTWSGWVKRSSLGAQSDFFSAGNASDYLRVGGFNSSDQLELRSDSAVVHVVTDQVFRDVSAWYHVVIAVDTTQSTSSNRVKFYVNGSEITDFSTSTYPSQNRQEAVNDTGEHRVGAFVDKTSATVYYPFNGYLADIHFIDGQALDPTSFTETDATTGQLVPIEYTGSFGTNGFHLPFSDNSSAAALGTDTSGQGNDWDVYNIFGESAVNYTKDIDLINGDPIKSGDNVYNIFDGNTSTGAETDNGLGKSLLFDFAGGSGSIPVSSNIQVWVGGSDGRTLKVNGSTIATNTGTSNNPYTITGQSQLDSVEVVSEASTRSGFLLQISVDGSPLISYDPKNNDSLVDTPTNGSQTDTGVGGEVVGNYCTWNPIASGSGATLTNGNLDYSLTGSSATVRQSRGTFLIPTSGKWYWEHTITTVGESNLGVIDFQTGLSSFYYQYDVGGWQNIYINSSQVDSVAGYTNGDVIGIGYDSDNQQIRFYKNGSQVGSNYSLTNTGQFVPYALHGSVSGSCSGSTNFGQRPFAFPAPSGFKALCTANLDDPLVAQPSTVMDVVTYTGTGSTQTISGLGFSPDFVWLKRRDVAANHLLHDIIRGPQKVLESSSTNAEVTESTVTSFNSDGFTVGTQAGANGLNNSIVAWTWDAGSSTVTNTDGSITSSVRANASAGFSIVTWTGSGVSGDTVGHGLNAQPFLILSKRRNAADYWPVYHKNITAGNALKLDGTDAQFAGSQLYTATAPTSSVFSVGSNDNINGNGDTYVAYCFAPVAGYSSFGSYTGNGSADGPFVYTGFRPRWILWKNASAAQGWYLMDTARNKYNVANSFLRPNSSDAEANAANSIADILSNGFKLRGNGSDVNGSGNTIIYAAFAESPQKYSRAR